MATKTTPTAVAERQADALDAPRPDFFMFTDAMKAHEDGDRPTVLCTASSTAVDLEADRFTAKALKQMKAGFVGKLIFLNHSYTVPHDVFGVVLKAELIKREGRLDLDLVIGVEMNNPLAVQTHQYIVNGTRLGVSVGVIVTDAEKSDEEDQYGKTIFDIDGVIPLEASVVGIPANQTAWTRQAIKSLFARGALDLDNADIEARPWLKTAVQVKEAAKAKAATGEAKQKDTRLWVTTDDGEVVVEITGEQKEAIMAQANGDETPDETKDETDEERAAREAAAADGSVTKPDETKDDDAKPDEKPDETKDETDDKPDDAKDDDAKPDATKDDDSDDKPDEERAAREAAAADGSVTKPDETKDDDAKPDEKPDETKDDEKPKDFDDDVAADEAVDVLIGKMFTGLYVALDNLIPILMDTDLSAGERAKQGKVVIDDWNSFVEETWDEITDDLNSDKDVEPDENFDLATSLHAHIAKQDEVSCDQHGIEAVTAKVKEISDAAEVTADANAQLRADNERQAKVLKLAQGVIEAMMELPLKTVTTREQASAQSLAKHFPGMDARVVERMARYAPSDQSE